MYDDWNDICLVTSVICVGMECPDSFTLHSLTSRIHVWLNQFVMRNKLNQVFDIIPSLHVSHSIRGTRAPHEYSGCTFSCCSSSVVVQLQSPSRPTGRETTVAQLLLLFKCGCSTVVTLQVRLLNCSPPPSGKLISQIVISIRQPYNLLHTDIAFLHGIT